MKHKAKGYITIPVEAVFDYEGTHSISDQAIEAIRAEAQCDFCLKDGEGDVELMDITPLGKE
jgi:hypothetical protein